MKKFLSFATIAAACVAIVPAAASASVTPHVCSLPGGAVTASGYTSCSFASGMAKATGSGTAYVYSSVTHQQYRVTCHYPRGFMSGDEVRCTSSGTDSWAEFFWFPNRSQNRYMPMDSVGMPECGG